ncbi:hypothetical protein C8J57DRAFT_1509951 [Mycena rebaudengoi]|nr:hypothetical protein C8J57DRAFT_1509951 [Mycena rebaudengoi]
MKLLGGSYSPVILCDKEYFSTWFAQDFARELPRPVSRLGTAIIIASSFRGCPTADVPAIAGVIACHQCSRSLSHQACSANVPRHRRRRPPALSYLLGSCRGLYPDWEQPSSPHQVFGDVPLSFAHARLMPPSPPPARPPARLVILARELPGSRLGTAIITASSLRGCPTADVPAIARVIACVSAPALFRINHARLTSPVTAAARPVANSTHMAIHLMPICLSEPSAGSHAALPDVPDISRHPASLITTSRTQVHSVHFIYAHYSIQKA